MYVAIDRNPEMGYEIQDSACEKSGTMLSIRLVKNYVEDNASIIHQYEDGAWHGTKIFLNLASTWAFRNRVVCAGLYILYVEASEALKDIGV